MMRALVALPLISLLFTPAASAEERCIAGQYRLAESIAEDKRPYLVCGLLRGRDGHFAVRLNGQAVVMTGSGADSCDRVRQSAVAASDIRLVAAMPDATARKSFILAEFEKADRFLLVAARSQDLTVGEDPISPQCRTLDAQNR